MGELRKDSDRSEVSALQSALKLLRSLWLKLKYYSGLLVIDKMMRNVVRWYDSRHGGPLSGKHTNGDEDLVKLRGLIALKNDECDKLHSRLKMSEQDKVDLGHQINQLEQALSTAQASNIAMKRKITELLAKNDILKSESQDLKMRCLPAKDVPSMIYYAQADATGQCLRKASPKRTGEHIFKLITNPGNTMQCHYKPVVATDAHEIIANRNVTLMACDITGIAPDATRIEVLEEGEAIFEDNKWKVTRKAKIKLS